MLTFSEQFMQQEVRQGFCVSELMKHCWAADLQALEDVRQLCQKHSLHFFAAYGTLLGTVREEGFIPWDDDVDIGMVRDDYIRFLELASTELPEGYEILNSYTRPWFCMNFTHLSNGRDMSLERGWLKRWYGCPFLTGPDIYPYYYLPRDPQEESFVLALLEKVDRAIALNRQAQEQNKQNGTFRADSRLNEALAESLVELQHETGFEFGTQRPLDNQLEILYDQICRITEEADADYLVRYDEYCKNKSKKFPKDWLLNTVELPFEEVSMPVPVVYDEVLKKRFGGAYIVPRIENAMHEYPYFKKQLRPAGRLIEKAETELRKQGREKKIFPADGRKVLVYRTAVPELLIYSEYAIRKIKELLSFFKERQKEICFCWVPGEFLRTKDMAFDLVAPHFIREYEELVEAFREEGWGICEQARSPEELARMAEVYLGDEGVFAEAFRKEKKQVMLQDYRKPLQEEEWWNEYSSV